MKTAVGHPKEVKSAKPKKGYGRGTTVCPADNAVTEKTFAPEDATDRSPIVEEWKAVKPPHTPQGHYISIVVPFLNEEESLVALYQEITDTLIQAHFESYEIIFIDDGSTDRSHEICCELYERDPNHVHVIKFTRNYGQTAALAAGFHLAKGDLIIPMDADLQNDPTDIERLVAKIDEGYDVVSGWRVSRKDNFISRRIPSKLANLLISWMTGVRLHDYGCTLKAYQKNMAQHIQFYGEMHRFLPALASWAGARVTEMKVNHRPRRFGKSKYSYTRIVRVVLDLITVKFLLSYSTKPMQVFGAWGVLSLFIAFISGAYTLTMKIVDAKHHDITSNPYIYISMFCTMGAIQLIGMGLLGEISVRTYYESQRKAIYTIREIHSKENHE